ncbi:hypothetical protein CFR73_09595 [Novacetimonas maltaceti]|uniref:Uncharacterized protein n=1 Tax=Novacetimonas maltaceti TaxID=1203393 RepID=A0A2S3W422_9PROT|nr:hypothetical protein [Novacetimonas maltaceti]POF63558.1 hypothetical protein KMAL_07380 [Novacetimonas maltaceti]PYD59831.1 hypothetical protein CFR73_09595 [Novacetimonas maltaceti]
MDKPKHMGSPKIVRRAMTTSDFPELLAASTRRARYGDRFELSHRAIETDDLSALMTEAKGRGE